MSQKPDEVFTIEVNGIEIKVQHEKLVASDVLELAIKHKAITGKSDQYILESEDPRKEFKPEDWVNFHEYKEFSAERSAPTPVANNQP